MILYNIALGLAALLGLPLAVPLSLFSRAIAGSHDQPTVSRTELEVLAEIGRREGTLDEDEWQVVTNVIRLDEVTDGAGRSLRRAAGDDRHRARRHLRDRADAGREAGLDAISRGIVTAVDARKPLRTVAGTASLGTYDQGFDLDRGGREITVEIDTRVSVTANPYPEQVATVDARIGRAADHGDSVVAAAVIGQRQLRRIAGIVAARGAANVDSRQAVSPIAALHRVVVRRQDAVGFQVKRDFEVAAGYCERDVADCFYRRQRMRVRRGSERAVAMADTTAFERRYRGPGP